MDSGSKLAAWFGAIFGFAALLVATAALSSDDTTKAASAAQSETIAVKLGDLFLEPDRLSVTSGADVTLKVTNTGGIEHDLSVASGPRTPPLKPGESATLHVGKVTGPLELLCSVPGHADAGMRTTLSIGSGEVSDARRAHDDIGGDG